MLTHEPPIRAAAGPRGALLLDRMGIPRPLIWGFVAVLVFMTGNGVESNFITPHLVDVLGSPEATVANIITGYSLGALVGSYFSGALADLIGPRRVMLLGATIWVVFEIVLLIGLDGRSIPLTALAYSLRGLGYPIFVFAFLVWVNITSAPGRRATAVGWFYVAYTGGMPTLGALFALGAIPALGGGTVGETGAMIASIGLVVAGLLLAWFGVREPRGRRRIAPAGESRTRVLTSGVRLLVTRPKILMGFLIRMINTAPEFGMFVVLPAVIADQRGWGQSRWLLMTVCVYATNILANAVFGAVGDRFGWQRTVRWFGVLGCSIGLLAWWYVPQLVPAGSEWGYWVSVAAGCIFGCMLPGFVPMGAIMPALVPEHRGAAMAVYTTAAGGSAFLGTGVVAVVLALGGGGAAVVWAFIALYGVAFVFTYFMTLPSTEGAPR